MRIIALMSLMVVAATFQLTQTEVEAAALDQVKDAAKTIVNSAADKADSVTEVPQTGGVMQTVLHKTASVVLDKGVDLVAAKYPIVKVAAPHIKKFSKPVLNAAHSKINNMFDKSDDEKTTTVAPSNEATKTNDENKENKSDDENNDKPSLMDKIKGAVGIEKEENDEENKNEQVEKVDKEEKPKEEAKDKKRKRNSSNKKKDDGEKTNDGTKESKNIDENKETAADDDDDEQPKAKKAKKSGEVKKEKKQDKKAEEK